MNRALTLKNPAVPPALAGAAIAGSAVVLGALVVVEPLIALALVGLVLLVILAFFAPVAHLTLLILMTAIVPYGLQNRFGGADLLPSDALLVSGLFRAGIVLLQERMDRRRVLACGLVLAFIVVAGIQAFHGAALGRGTSQVGHEFRVLLGFGTLLVAMPIVSDEQARPRLFGALLFIGLVLGLWGLAQWTLNLQEIDESGAGVREGVAFTTAGRGQIQGGLYAFPVAIVLAFAALLSGRVRSLNVRLVLIATLLLNLVSMLLTYERTFWVATVVGMGFVVLGAGRTGRWRAFVWVPAVVVLLFAAMSTLAPGELTAARERLLSLGQYSNDDSVRSRIVESRYVVDQIEARPGLGSGLGATIFWGRPWQQVPSKAHWYTHNGYLWLSWKIGIPAAALLILLLAWAVLARGAAREDELLRSVRNGSQAALFVLLASSVTFPAFNALAISATIGMLAAICLAEKADPAAARLAAAARAGAAPGEREVNRRLTA